MFGKSKKPDAAPPPSTPAAPEPPPLPPAAVRTFEQRQADYAAAEREIAGEHEATLAELTRRKKAAQEHRDKQLLELEARKAEDTRVAAVLVNTKARDEIAPVFGRLFEQVNNAEILALVDAFKRTRSTARELGHGLSVPRFLMIALEVFRSKRPGLVHSALQESFWRYNDFTRETPLHAASELLKAVTSGNLPAARAAFETLELTFYSFSRREPTPDDLARWEAKVDPDPTVSKRLELERETKAKDLRRQNAERHNGAWMKHQAARRKGSNETWVPPTPLEHAGLSTAADVFVP